MNIKLPYGSTAENDQLNLEPGFLSIDIERKALRVFDGVTQGGFEVIGVPARTLPGNNELIAGDQQLGYYGQVAAADLITGADLNASITFGGVGTAHNSDAGWLQFAYEGKVLYVAKRSLRYSIPYQHLNALNLINGSHVITIGGNQFKVRLLRGANTNPADAQSGYDIASAAGSEWNRLLYRVSAGPFIDASTTFASEGISPGLWDTLSEAELGMHKDQVLGSYSWCQEQRGAGTGNYIARGYFGVSYVGYDGLYQNQNYTGWRPVLELI